MSASYIRRYAIIYKHDGFLLFGGYTSSSSSTIARLDARTTTWSKLGDLQTARYAHSVIYDGEAFLVIGGLKNGIQTEKCVASGLSITCAHQMPTLEYYAYYPGLFLVPHDYCTQI